jgi:hypothetical protein
MKIIMEDSQLPMKFRRVALSKSLVIKPESIIVIASPGSRNTVRIMWRDMYRMLKVQ